ncbi:pyrroline-5-carboxylate reductase family protein [Schleiferilactobacillus shenzhenensis]|uniref:Pyrroline-5-carboxylate reductase n=1 Tax=Schleiferilactobacillus shenzhenensis LY-73 TaxID=1231336 RepID=U4TQI7_9LACO|nr:pyrroline-5-carboxylate reductase dimerization domain-containing protein [Schleiferilactobacillus shenzhenensis]ERL64168.1 pyrroline-5-carboxylate reductase [Schleiferilactobacillus shenzhenensis LY-73]
MVKIGFIGSGHMASAEIAGTLHAGAAAADLFVTSRTPAHFQAVAKQYGIHGAASAADIVAAADIVVLATPPATAAPILGGVAGQWRSGQILVSVVGSVSVADLTKFAAAPNLPIVRLLPNVNVATGSGMTAYAVNEAVTDTALQTVLTWQQSLGDMMPLAEDLFGAFVGLAGSSPAFIFVAIDMLARLGVKYGIPMTDARRIAAQAFKGSADQILATGANPWDLADSVSSPGGSTVRGMVALQSSGFFAGLTDAVTATIEKDQAKK